ncbi:xanthine dehydrogenase family protein molybdopterin-binding subunit [Coralliovum pocilloporae]|uniref:xanthine dehydrogenase family protein molybdopterin-binding subunit n=1 Tax=Coralliovum pocilloporae TaxID=3066369 RepID=UPI0033077DD5
MTVHTNRRGFLKGAAGLGAALFVGVSPSGVLAASSESTVLNPFVRISEDGVVTVIIKHFEMGQGTTTGLSTLVAEELDADWDSLTVDFAPSDNNRYANLLFGSQGTGGSTAIANSFMQYRQAGAAARDVLVQAAAKRWAVAPSDIHIEKGVMSAGDRKASFGAFIQDAAKLTPKSEPALKDPSAFRLIGKDHIPRKDSASKTNGTATFAMDVTVPGMVYAVVLHAPRFGAVLKSFDSSEAASMPGFIGAKALANKTGVAVYAKSTWAAIKARDVITADWDDSNAETRSSDALIAHHKDLLDTPQHQGRKGSDAKTVEAAVAGASSHVDAEFIFPNLAHAPMEPLNCVIEPTENGVRVHDGCQFPAITHPTIAAILGLKPEQVEIKTVYAGGSFGRRATPTSDYQADAAFAFAALGGKTPVKLVWTREDDIRGGYYRPMAAHRARIGLDEAGRITGWDHRIAAKSILKGTPFEAVLVHDGIDETSVEGVGNSPYDLPNFSVGLSDAESRMPVLWWRAVGHTHNAYAMEVLMDMAAHKAGRDPVEFRLDYLSGGSKDHQRLAGVLKKAAEASGWGQAVPEGKGRGIAVHKSFNSYVAHVVDVSLNDDGAIRIDKVTCAVDCGVPVNPDVIRAQMEGGVGYGLGAVMRNAITLTDGVVDQDNFPDYEPLRMSDMPDVEVHIIPSTEPPTGVGEPGLPPAGPALANAIHDATGRWVTSLPMAENGIEFA